jgi:hypothetical protein
LSSSIVADEGPCAAIVYTSISLGATTLVIWTLSSFVLKRVCKTSAESGGQAI